MDIIYGTDDNEIFTEDSQTAEEQIQDNNKQGDELLIDLVRTYPHIYSKAIKKYKDISQKMKDNSWSQIASIMGSTVSVCQTRWLRLREKWSRENKRINDEYRSGNFSGSIWPLFEQMNFLKRHVLTRKRFKKVKSCTENISETIVIEADPIETVDPCQNYQRNRHFKTKERLLLSVLVNDFKDVLEMNCIYPEQRERKLEAWRKITELFNEQSEVSSSIESLKNLYKNMKHKAQRGEPKNRNFKAAERLLLSVLVNDYKDVLEDNGIYVERKRTVEAWNKITELFNEQSQTYRSVDSLRILYKNMKHDALKDKIRASLQTTKVEPQEVLMTDFDPPRKSSEQSVTSSELFQSELKQQSLPPLRILSPALIAQREDERMKKKEEMTTNALQLQCLKEKIKYQAEAHAQTLRLEIMAHDLQQQRETQAYALRLHLLEEAHALKEKREAELHDLRLQLLMKQLNQCG